ncbi:MAG TPA: hypothetical protein DEH25_05340 [Chloroflexi bacterium]|nr:hypothetical protein [Chloroflexota bacterium]HBY06448.1 hypothetical protein [Chloroflexota bacterium]
MDEKQEKFDEKEMEKHDEKSTEEKNYDEKYRRDPLGAIVWAVILIWVGIVLLAQNLGYLEQLGLRLKFGELPFVVPFVGDSWSLIFLGIAFILLIEVVVRLLVPDYRRPLMGTVIFLIVCLGVAFGSWDLIWPLILIAIGASVLLRGFFRSKE